MTTLDAVHAVAQMAVDLESLREYVARLEHGNKELADEVARLREEAKKVNDADRT